MTLMLGRPMRILPEHIRTTNMSQDDAAEWNSATSYTVGQRVILAAERKLYECVQAHSNKTPASSANIGTFWVVVSSTNMYKPFDFSTALPAVGPTAPSGSAVSIWYQLRPDRPRNAIAALGVLGGRVAISTIKQDGTRRNQLNRSEEFANAYWTKNNSTIGQNFARDPWFGIQADALIETISTGIHNIQADTYSFVSGTSYTLSIYAKRLGSSTRNLRLFFPSAQFASAAGVFDIVNGTVVSGASPISIEDVGEGWYRCSITRTASSSGSGVAADFALTNGTDPSYLGTLQGMFITGAMMNVGGTLLPYQYTLDTYIGTYSNVRNKLIVYDAGDPDSNPAGDVIFTGLDTGSGDTINITITKSSATPPEVREILVMGVEPMGLLIEPHDGTILDFSRKDRNEFGDVTLIPRGTADRQTYTFRIPREFRAAYRDLMKSIRARPHFWYSANDEDNLLGLDTFGFWTEYTDSLTLLDEVFPTVTVESVS
jgi:hypothetical protein